MDKLISVKGLVIRATPIIPDMKEGTDWFPSFVSHAESVY
jgi:DNA replicative helicase MCM subunit Mcm2 (Cdc46/Mcm family)